MVGIHAGLRRLTRKWCDMATNALGDSRPTLPVQQAARGERLSALADGELSEAEAVELAREAARDDALAARWLVYHQIGDVLRCGELRPHADAAFLQRMRVCLAAEAVVIAPRAATRRLPPGGWKLASGFAAVAAVAVVTWGVLPSSRMGSSGSGTELARVPVVAPATAGTDVASLQIVNTANGAMLRDARLDQYFSAHGRVGSVMSTPASFVRTATIENDSGK